MKLYIPILLFLIGLAFSAQAQLPQYHAQVFGEEYGFGDGIIFDIFEDHEQFIWVTTPTSLQRFDGRNVRKYPFDDAITHAICDADGRIWVLTGPGFGIWRNRSDWKGFEQIKFDSTGDVRLRGIFQMENGPVHVITTKGLYAWRAEFGAFQRLSLDFPGAGQRHNSNRIDTCMGTLIYPIVGGVCAYNMATGQTRTVPVRGEYAHLFAVTPDLAVMTGYLAESYWIDFKRGELREIDAKHYGLSPDLHKTNILSFAPMGDGKFLVGSKFGLLVYDLTKDTFHPERVFAAGKPIANEKTLCRIFKDKNGTFWAHSNTSILAIRPMKNSIGLLRNYHFEAPEQWDNRVYGMTEDDRGNIWFGGLYGFKKLNLQTGQIITYLNVEGATDRLKDHVVKDILWDGKNLLLGTPNNGLWLFEPLTKRYRRPLYTHDTVRRALEGEVIDEIGRMRNGDFIVCGRFFVHRIKSTTYQVDLIRFPGDNSNMNTVFQDTKGRVWLGSQRGLHCLDEQYRFLFEVPISPDIGVSSIFQIGEGEMLVGTSKGFLKLRMQPDNRYALEPVLLNGEQIGVQSISRDSLKRFWLGTSNGLYLADPALTTFQKFDFADNIQSHVFNPGSVLQASNGDVFLGGQNGINYFRPKNIAMGDQVLNISLQSISINDGDSLLNFMPEVLKLRYWQNTLDFEVVAPYYNNAAKVQYRYRIWRNSKSGAWVELGPQNLFRLPDLLPGEYRLDVAASLTGKAWYEIPKPLAFSIAPPFWQTWWFRLLAFTGLASLFFAFIRYREKRWQHRQEQQLEMEKLRSTTLQYELEIEQVVNYFNRSISEKSTVDEALWDVAQQCIARLGWEDCVIYLLDPERTVLVQKAAWGQKSTPDQKIVSPIEIKMNQGIVGTVAATGRAELIPDTAHDPRYIVDDASRRSELAVPILAEGRAIGVIDSEHSQKGFYTPWHLQILTAIAALCSNKIVLTQIEEARQEVRRQLEEKEKSLLEIEKRSAQIRLIALTNHLNPHFLFNSLTSLNSLIFENQQLASDFLQHLSKVYRYLLQHKEKETVSLKNEIDFVENYIFLLKTRFGDDILIDIKMPQNGVLEKGIVPVTLQILIENAVKHNVISAQNPLVIKVETDGNTLSVTNNIQRKKQVETSNRQGLESLRALYHYLSDRPLEVVETTTHFTVTLPLIET
ncbi:MAG: histidine kinase [Saprospiraceae bacterium]